MTTYVDLLLLLMLRKLVLDWICLSALCVGCCFT